MSSCRYSTHITLDKCLKSGFETKAMPSDCHSCETLQTSSPTCVRWSSHGRFLLWESLLWLFLPLFSVLSACCMLSFAQESKRIPLKNLLSLRRTPAWLLWALVMRTSDLQLIKNSPQVKQTIEITCGIKNRIHNSAVWLGQLTDVAAAGCNQTVFKFSGRTLSVWDVAYNRSIIINILLSRHSKNGPAWVSIKKGLLFTACSNGV